MKTKSIFALLAAIAFSCSAIAGDAKLDEKIKAIDSTVEKSDADALKAFSIAKIKMRQKALEDLAKLKKEAFAKEDLDGAKAAKDRIDAVNKEVDDLLAGAAGGEVKEVAKAEVKADKSHPQIVVGRWNLQADGWHHYFIFSDDGAARFTCSNDGGDNGGVEGKWEVKGNYLIMTAKDGRTWSGPLLSKNRWKHKDSTVGGEVKEAVKQNER